AASGEGVFVLSFEGLLPVADEVWVEAEGACGLGDGVALLGDELDGLGLELGGVGASRAWHCWTSQREYTPLTECPRFVGKSKLTPKEVEQFVFDQMIKPKTWDQLTTPERQHAIDYLHYKHRGDLRGYQPSPKNPFNE